MRDDELKHYGVKGMRWGVRRYQNADGSLNKEGQKRYGTPQGSIKGTGYRLLAKNYDIGAKVYRKLGNKSLGSIMAYQRTKAYKNARNADIAAREKSKNSDKSTRLKKTLKTAGRVATDVATLGVSRKIRKRENEIKKHGNDIMFRYEVGANAIGRVMKFQSRRKILNGMKMVAALAGVGAYVASNNNPKVKKGAMAAGKILNTLSNVSLATLAAYDIYDTYRDIKDVYGKQKGRM